MRNRANSLIFSAGVLAAITIAASARADLAPPPARQPQPTGALQETELRVFPDANGPVVRFPDGREYRLLPITEKQQARFAAEEAKIGRAKAAAPAFARAFAAALPTPDTVDNRRFQGPIRDQSERGTCVSFSTTAAVE